MAAAPWEIKRKMKTDKIDLHLKSCMWKYKIDGMADMCSPINSFNVVKSKALKV